MSLSYLSIKSQNYRRPLQIQRLGVKILKSKTFMDRTKNKVQVANLIFNSLCNLPGMDDFVLHAKEIGNTLNSLQFYDDFLKF